MREIRQTEVTFEIIEVRTVRDKKKSWVEIEVKVTDDHGSRIKIVREGDVLKAIFEGEILCT